MHGHYKTTLSRNILEYRRIDIDKILLKKAPSKLIHIEFNK